MDDEAIRRLYGEPFWREWGKDGWVWEKDFVGGLPQIDEAIWRKGRMRVACKLSIIVGSTTPEERARQQLLLETAMQHEEERLKRPA